MTAGVSRELAPEEIAAIVRDLQAFIREKNGIDYLQTYDSDDGRRVFCICQLSWAMKASGEYAPEDDYWTMLVRHEAQDGNGPLCSLNICPTVSIRLTVSLWAVAATGCSVVVK